MHEIESSCQPEKDVYKGLRVYVVTLLVLTGVAWSVVGIRGAILHEPYPRNTLYYKPEIRFTDFTDLSERVAHFGEPNMLSRTDLAVAYPYPVPSIYAYLFFIRLSPHPLRAYLIFILLSFVGATCFFLLGVKRATKRKLPQLAVWSTLLLGFPLQFLIDRGNIEAVIWVLVLLGLVAYTRNRTLASAILWSIAASMKIFPGLLFLLFLGRRKFGAFVFAIVATGLFSLLALAGVGPTIRQAAADSSKSAPLLLKGFIVIRSVPGFDHSLLQTVKQAIYLSAWAHKSSNDPMAPDTQHANEIALRLYNIVIPLAAFVLYGLRLRRMPLLNQFMAYMVLCVILPYISYDYTLVYVYFVWGSFLLFLVTDVVRGRVTIPSSAIHLILVSCAVIFAPLTYLEIGNAANRTFAFGAQVKTIFLLLILVTVLRIPMPSSLFGDLQLPAPGDSSGPA